MNQIGRYFDQSRCIGCYTCISACRSWNELPPGAPDLIRLLTTEEGEFPNISLRHIILTCFHCSEPVCIPACPTDCISKRESDGQVSINTSECIFCGKCQEECPYDAPRFSNEEASPAMLCTLCVERLAKREKPACVISCPVEALDVALMDELVNKYGDTRQISGFADPQLSKPNIIFKARE